MSEDGVNDDDDDDDALKNWHVYLWCVDGVYGCQQFLKKWPRLHYHFQTSGTLIKICSRNSKATHIDGQFKDRKDRERSLENRANQLIWSNPFRKILAQFRNSLRINSLMAGIAPHVIAWSCLFVYFIFVFWIVVVVSRIFMLVVRCTLSQFYQSVQAIIDVCVGCFFSRLMMLLLLVWLLVVFTIFEWTKERF